MRDTHDQLIDETGALITETVRRNIRLARELALNMDLPIAHYDEALDTVNGLEIELRMIAGQEER